MAAGAVSAPLIIPIIHLPTHRTKNHIDTSTPVSIQSDTAGVLLFYTLDGSKPAAAQRRAAGGSRKYSEPILLPAGRVSVRAVAVTSDGRRSSVVTKVFSVDVVDSGCRTEDEDDVLRSHQQRPSEGGVSEHTGLQEGPCFLNGRLGSGTAAAAAQTGSSRRLLSAGPGEPKQTSGLQRKTDFLRYEHMSQSQKCAQCLRPRPSDPLARFCAQCGAIVPPLPNQRLLPAEGGQTLLCVFCNALVPVNTHTCLICEAAIDQQRQPQASLTLQDHVVCVYCGSGNPAHVSSCVTCERRLQPVGCVRSSAPSVPAADSRMWSCSRCNRMNRGDARYCDWCGCKPAHAASCVTCWRCGASGHPYAFYCAACGVFLEAPATPTSCSDITRPAEGTTTSQPPTNTPDDATRQATPSAYPASNVKLAPPTVDQYTQTAGLYYPSATELQRKEQQRALQLSRQQATRDRRPPLTTVSPGRGYWRKQLDHVCAHLRSYTQNHAPFRALLGEPRLGRMVSAAVQEDRYEVSLTVSFVSAPRVENQVGPEGAGPAGGAFGLAGHTETLSSVTERPAGSSLRSERSSGLMTAPHPPVRDGQLLKELSPGRGQISTIQQLLDQGADPSCRRTDGRHALVVAVENGHHDVLPVLVQQGANVDEQSGQMKNTALHEAAALGAAGLQCAEVLLSCQASARRRNAAGQTAFDVAVSSGCSSMASLLAAQMGLDLLGKLGKPKRNLDAF